MNTPTVGRQVHFFRSGYEGINRTTDQPMAATIAFVHGPKSLNLQVTDHQGNSFPMEGVRLREEGDPDDSRPYCAWPERTPG